MANEYVREDKPMAYLVGGALYAPDDFREVCDGVADLADLVPLTMEHEGFSYRQFQNHPDAPARWEAALLKNHAAEIEAHRKKCRRNTVGVIAHCSGCHRALELLEKFNLDFAVLINPPSQRSHRVKLMAMGPAPQRPQFNIDIHRTMLHPLTPNYDVQRWIDWGDRHIRRFEEDPSALEASVQTSIRLLTSRPVVDTICAIAQETRKPIWMLRDPNDPWDCGEVENAPPNVRQGKFENGGHYLHVFHPEKVVAYLRAEVLGKIATPLSSPAVPQYTSPS